MTGRRQPHDPAALEAAALRHLARYAASRGHLRRLLRARLERLAARGLAVDLAAGAAAIEPLLDKLQDLGLLDDRGYAKLRARALQRRGAPARAIAAELRAKGVAPELIDGALEQRAPDEADAELSAALAFARKRRLGPFRADVGERAARRGHDLAALGRKGFDQAVARRVIDCTDPEELAAEARGARQEDGAVG